MTNDAITEMMYCRIALQKHYNSLSNSQAVRIIGFVAGLFSILQVVLTSGKGQFSSLFPGLSVVNMSYTQFELFILDLIRFILFLVPVFILLFYIFRSIFRFAVFSAYSSHVRWIEDTEIKYLLKKEESLRQKNMMILLDLATSRKISGNLKKNEDENYPRSSIYKFFYYDWFMGGKNKFKGYLLCSGLSFLSIFILLAILW